MQVIHQCPHYQRNCEVEAPCCKIFYPCKLCHDEKYVYKKGCQVDRMQFNKVRKIKCLNCQQIQKPSEVCQKCQTKFGQYTCLKCMLYENNPEKLDDIFHCDDCKMCRRGTPQSVTHCFKCGYCIPNANKNHKCLENVATSNCPVCLEQLLYSTKRYFDLKCGHLIHVECYTQLKDINCPTCGMAQQKMSKQHIQHVDKQVEKMSKNIPSELKETKVSVLCNECLHKTMNVPFHFYVKCQKCGTYNTKQI